MAWCVSHYDLSGWQIAGAVIGVAWMSVLPLVPAAHELYHAPGKTLYNFAPSAVKLSTIQEQMIECDALEKRGYGRWSIRHKLWRAILSQLIFQSLMFWIGAGPLW